MRVTLRHNITGRVFWEDEVECPDDASEAVKRGLAVAAARKAGASLRGAYLSGAYLSGADLSGAYLSGAHLGGADLRGAIWGDGAKWAEDVFVTRDPVFVSTGIYDVWLLDTHAQIGCPGVSGFLHGIEAWAAFGDAEIARMDGARSLAFWREWRAPLLAIASAAGRPVATAAAGEGPA